MVSFAYQCASHRAVVGNRVRQDESCPSLRHLSKRRARMQGIVCAVLGDTTRRASNANVLVVVVLCAAGNGFEVDYAVENNRVCSNATTSYSGEVQYQSTGGEREV